MTNEQIFALFKKNCVDHPGNYEITPGQALRIAKTLLAASDRPFGAVCVCPERDIECGNHPQAWCATCPKQPALDRPSPAPAGLIELLREIRPKHGAVGTRDVDVTEQQRKIDAAIALLSSDRSSHAGWIDDVLRDVAELPDRTSPDNQPEMMLVSAAELREIIARHAPACDHPSNVTGENNG